MIWLTCSTDVNCKKSNIKMRDFLGELNQKYTKAKSKEIHGVWVGPYAGVDYNLTLRVCPLQSRLQHIY